MARSEPEMASANGAMRAETALQHSKCREFEPSAQGRYWMARGGYLFSVDLILMELQIPLLDGLGATAAIRRFENTYSLRAVPIVAYSLACPGARVPGSW